MADAMIETLPESPRTRLRMSYEAYLLLAEDVRAEWSNGEVIIFMPPKKQHQRVVEFLHTLLDLFVQALRLGRVGIAPFEIKLGPGGPAREPDLFFVATEGIGQWTTDRFEGGPDLVVEVISRDSVGRDRGDKFYEYQAAGVREYWILDSRPGTECADFYVLDASGVFQPALPDGQAVFHSRVLPGFVLRLEWLWQDPAPSAFSVLAELARLNPALATSLRQTLG